jgi:23S rRNA (adenine2503-C2)-methyltransferase
MKGINDSDANAIELVGLLKGVSAKVNLIQYNENVGLGFSTTVDNRAEAFRSVLDQHGIAAFIRANRGRDIAAACGQLANVETQGARFVSLDRERASLGSTAQLDT